MKMNHALSAKIKYLILLILPLFWLGCDDTTEVYTLGKTEHHGPSGKESDEEIAVTPPPFSDDVFPCTECHAHQEPNPVRRILTEWHEEISEIFDHDSANRWCMDCHDLNNRDSLRLASGKLLDFKESYKLCGQCHGDKLRDWKVGVHGKRIGYWNGKKQYFLCVSCHNPHSPMFKQLKPEAPPARLEEEKKDTLQNSHV